MKQVLAATGRAAAAWGKGRRPAFLAFLALTATLLGSLSPSTASACTVAEYFRPGDTAGSCSPTTTNVSLRPGAPDAPKAPQAQVTAMTGSEQRFFGPPASVWVSNGLTEVRGVKLTGTFAFSGSGVNLAGTETVVTNASLDATNNGYTWGTNTYTDTATGLKCTGAVNGPLVNSLATLIIVAPCRNGGMLVGTVQDISTDPPNAAPPVSVKSSFKGVYIGPSDR
jgi:hypothetical protein